MFRFQINHLDSETRARAGVFQTAHGAVETPVFMPVGTQGSVKALSPEELLSCGTRIILGNTYHLYLRPGCEVVELFSGLHRFIQWDRPILTDSGGFQAFSLAKLSRVSEEGIAFQSHLDGSSHVLSPEKAVEIQLCLNSDIIMCLDQCLKYPETDEKLLDALHRTTRWAQRCKNAWMEKEKNALFGIIQGGMNPELRTMSLEALLEVGFDGYAVGGLSVGEPKELMLEMAAHTLARMPEDFPRYVMGVGSPEDLVEMVGFGADMFDCVLPTRNARNGQLFTRFGNLNIANACHRTDQSPAEAGCGCYTCRSYSRAYLRHLFMARELLSYRLNTIHNLHYYHRLMAEARRAILDDRYAAFKKDFHETRAKGE